MWQGGVRLTKQPNLRVAMTAPSTATYFPDALGAPGQSIRLRLMNDGEVQVTLPRPSLSLSSAREGVPFPCASPIGRAPGAREPGVLGPKQSLVIERNLDCSMPLPGRYTVSAAFSLEGTDRGEPIGSFVLNVEAASIAPRAYPSRPGLYVMMAADRSSKPLSPAAWARGDYHVVVAAINASPRVMAIGSARVGFLTYKKGSPYPCAGQTEHADFSDELGPGAMQTVHLPLTCAPSEAGDYEIVGFLQFEGTDRAEMGHVTLTVSSAPTLYIPDPWPTFDVPRDLGP